MDHGSTGTRATGWNRAHTSRWLGAVVGVAFAVAASATHASTVTTVGSFAGYSGPVGAPIYAGSPPTRDPAQYDSTFAVGIGVVQTFVVAPQTPHPGYEDPAFGGTGRAIASFVGLPVDTSRVEFWNRIDSSFDEAHNAIQLTGTVTPNVAVGDLFHIATLSFTNGDWFRASPSYDPGLGQLYGESRFAFSLVANGVPVIGGGAHGWLDELVLRSVAGAGTPDVLYFANTPGLGAFSVAEGVTGSVEIWGRIGSLVPVELRNPSAGVTLIPVPEPSLAALLGAVALVLANRRRARRS
jgi:hypothetical protein